MSDILAQIKLLTDQLHTAGTVPEIVLDEFAAHAERGNWRRTMETGCGRTTLLISHYSKRHTVFAYERDDSVEKVFSSPLLRPDVVEFVPGSTQKTVPAYDFQEPFQLVLIDGPHAFPFPDLEYYHLYPHIEKGGLLIIDDIWIPTIHRLFTFLKEEPMFRLDKVVANTAFFIRTDTPTFDPYGDGWWSQPYNRRRFPMNQSLPIAAKVKLKHRAKQLLHALGLRKEF